MADLEKIRHNLVPLHNDGTGPNGQGVIQPARNPVRQFLLNMFGGWQENKPQLFKDVPITDMVTPQVAYLTGQGSPEESMAGFAGPARIRGGVQYGRYGKNAINYGAQQTKNYVAKEGQQFIRSQAENMVNHPGKPGTGTPSSPFSFTTQETAKPYSATLTELSKAEAGVHMGGLKPGSVEPVIPLSTRAKVLAIDAKNAAKGAASKVVGGVKNASTKATGPLRNAAAYTGYGAGALGIATGAGWVGSKFINSDKSDNSKNTNSTKSFVNQSTKPTTKSVVPTLEIPEGRKIVRPAAAPTQTTPTKPAVKTPITKAPVKAQTKSTSIQPTSVVKPTAQPVELPTQDYRSDLQSAEHYAINSERERLGNTATVRLSPLPIRTTADNQQLITKAPVVTTSKKKKK